MFHIENGTHSRILMTTDRITFYNIQYQSPRTRTVILVGHFSSYKNGKMRNELTVLVTSRVVFLFAISEIGQLGAIENLKIIFVAQPNGSSLSNHFNDPSLNIRTENV